MPPSTATCPDCPQCSLWVEDEQLVPGYQKPRLQFPNEHDRVERPVVTPEQCHAIVATLQEQGKPIHATCVRWLEETGMRCRRAGTELIRANAVPDYV